MITRFKLFENAIDDAAEELVDQFDDDFVDNYFRDNYEIDIKDACQYVNIWYFVDDDRFVRDYIGDAVGNCSGIEDANDDEEDWKKYILAELIDIKEVTDYLEKKAKKKKLDEDSTYEEILDELSKDQLKKIIVDIAKHDEDYIRDYYEGLYSSSDAHDILSEYYSESDLQENGYKYIGNYIDDDKVIEYYYDNEDNEYKKDFIKNELYRDLSLQTKLLKIKSENAILLFDVISDDNSIGDTYKFQNAFMKAVIKEAKENEEDDIYVAKKFKDLYDKFGLATGMEIKYKDYMFYIDVQKYNL